MVLAVRFYRQNIRQINLQKNLPLVNKKAPHKRGVAFGIDRNQESFLRSTNIPAAATNMVVNCKNFFALFSSGLYGL